MRSGADFAADATRANRALYVLEEGVFRAADTQYRTPTFSAMGARKGDGPFAVDDPRQIRGIAL